MAVNNYDIGTIVRLKTQFVDKTNNDNPIDPTTITIQIKTPDKKEQKFTYASGQVLRDSLGSYYYDFLVTQSGAHTFRYVGTGVCQTSGEQIFSVRPSNIITG